MNNKNLKLPLFPTSLMGSWLRSYDLLIANRKYRRNTITKDEYDSLVSKETKNFIKLQEKLGLDIITDGELYRDNFCSFVADRIGGVKLMSMAQMLDIVENKESFESILRVLDVPASSIKNAICIDKLKYKTNLVLNEAKFVKSITNKPLKMTLPGPYLLTRSMWLPEISKKAYASKESLADDVIDILIKEIRLLQDFGVDFIQLDEPVLTEIVFTEGKPRTFMCGSLAERKDPTEELIFASSLINKVLKEVNTNNISIHVCRGNWSSDESTLLTGPYTPLIPTFEKINTSMYTLEFATSRAGQIESLFSSEYLRLNIKLGLGIINPRIEIIESVDEVIKKVETTMKFISKNKIYLNPDCGFATFANRPLNVEQTAVKKIKVMLDAVKELRKRYDN